MPAGSVPAGSVPAGARRRGDTLRRAIYEAVFDQLQTAGYASLTMERVAATAHTSKAVLYRRWASKEQMVAEALRHALPAPADVALRGDLCSDVLALLQCIQTAFTATRGTAFQLVSAEAGCDRPLVRQAIIDHVVEPCTALILDVLRQAAERGVIRPDAANELVAAAGPAMLVQYSLIRAPIVPDEFVHSVVEQIIVRLTELPG
ncbi:TetR/AcrR family transcriptional regulator [Frankia sp. R82]|uniref:TetR/AcrR family transcriptional regulator n=1 Tax=Frankia sp. R82 TaxID=2950553 RepID=UPI002043F286|nr:TetR/AcrR family transcriptional regulator [Frankia sp. R82]MCM3884053.1 TetR/AcrR family transcriptional regulator [Frankia sp. R82]